MRGTCSGQAVQLLLCHRHWVLPRLLHHHAPAVGRYRQTVPHNQRQWIGHRAVPLTSTSNMVTPPHCIFTHLWSSCPGLAVPGRRGQQPWQS